MTERFRVIELGQMSYAEAYARQVEAAEELLAARAAGALVPGSLMFVEHAPPVITVSRRPAARAHLLASPAELARAGVTLAETDRGGDITYHGPGQLVAYPILDLHQLGLRIHDYLRLLEQAVIDSCAAFGVMAHRDPCATGVWVGGGADADGGACGATAGSGARKLCAMGIRVRRGVCLHGLALNVSTNLEHFGLIVPCGLAGRGVTSLRRELGDRCPDMATVGRALAASLGSLLGARRPGMGATPGTVGDRR
ncbi:MAG TPA: lipoyl(octanoyl) transferase LipB [Phycisphaerales bacterium]|nr:lipoyl(octanoyl) transferase LipB [Phycisphaerales bacterium]